MYRARKKSKKYKIWLALTKRRLKALDEANSILEAKKKSNDYFAFADLNCRLRVKLDGEFHYFGNMHELRSPVNNTEGEDGDEDDGNDGQPENEEEQDESVTEEIDDKIWYQTGRT